MKILINENPIYFKEYNINFYATRYSDGSLAIICEDEYCFPYATISINLSSYGVHLNDSMIILNHDLSRDFRDLVLNAFSKCSDEIQYGYAKSVVMYLKDEYAEIINKSEENEEY